VEGKENSLYLADRWRKDFQNLREVRVESVKIWMLLKGGYWDVDCRRERIATTSAVKIDEEW